MVDFDLICVSVLWKFITAVCTLLARSHENTKYSIIFCSWKLLSINFEENISAFMCFVYRAIACNFKTFKITFEVYF